MKRFLLMMLLCAALCLCLPALAEEGLTVTAAEDIRGFQDNAVTVNVPTEGTLTVTLSDELNLYRTIVRDKAVSAGETTLHFDGLAEQQERLPEDTLLLTATLTDGTGRTLTSESKVKIGRCRQAVLFALPSSDTLYLGGGEEWSAEIRLVRPGTMVTEFCRAEAPETPVYTRKKDMPGYKIHTYVWDGKVGTEQLDPGDWILRFYGEETPENVKEIRVTLSAEAAPILPLTVTADFLPTRDAADEDIWRAMMAPVTVVTLKSTSHQKLLDQPSKLGHSLGTVHGQSQALNVLEVRNDGWVKVGAWVHEDGSYQEGYVPADRLMTVQPQSEYGLLLDKQEQTLTVFHHGHRIGTMLMSTGLVSKNKLFQETCAGSFLTLEHMSDFSTNGNNYDYVIRFDGGNLLHQAAYRMTKGIKDFSAQLPVLGSKGSHGCVRLQPLSDGETLNAYWLWTHIPYHTKVLVLDDPDQREAEAAQVSGKAVQTVAELAESIAPAPLEAGETEITLTLGGDVVLGTREVWQTADDALPALLNCKGMSYPFEALAPLFQSDDMTLVNLECVLKEDDYGMDKQKDYVFRGQPSYTQVLSAAGIEQVNIANNHYIDYQKAGQKATRAALEAGGIAYSGYGYTYVADIGGHKIGFAGCRETVWLESKATIKKDIKALRAAGCEVVVYSCHWGQEYSATHNARQEKMAQYAVDAGADLVVGTHPHVVQGLTVMDGVPVLFSLGNLMFGGTHELVTADATLCRARLRFCADGYEGVSIEFLPVLISGSTAANDFHPTLAGGEDTVRIIEKIQTDSSLRLRDVMYFPTAK